ncbi:hypothetical protein EBZ35_00705 [bacterium]|nr:hypothetical protein [bacterium]
MGRIKGAPPTSIASRWIPCPSPLHHGTITCHTPSKKEATTISHALYPITTDPRRDDNGVLAQLQMGHTR